MTAAIAESPPSVERQTYSLVEFADLMGISYRHAAELAGEGAIPGVIRLGRRVLILREAVDSMLAEARRSLGPSGN